MLRSSEEYLLLRNRTRELIITKVEDPEELDTRFSRFSPAGGDWDSKRDGISPKLDGAEDLLNLLGKVKESISAVPGQEQTTPDTTG